MKTAEITYDVQLVEKTKRGTISKVTLVEEGTHFFEVYRNKTNTITGYFELDDAVNLLYKDKR